MDKGERKHDESKDDDQDGRSIKKSKQKDETSVASKKHKEMRRDAADEKLDDSDESKQDSKFSDPKSKGIKTSKPKDASEKVDSQKQKAQELTRRDKRKKSNDGDRTRLAEESSVVTASTNQLSVFGRALSGWTPLNQSIEDRDGSTHSCLPPITDEMVESHCFSRDECSWMCCKSERLGGGGYCAQYMLCAPMICTQRCAYSCAYNCLLVLGECPCNSFLRVGLHDQSPPRDPDILNDTRTFIRRHQERGHEDDICLIRVIGCDRPLLERVSVLHPMVRVHAVNIQTGQYLKRKQLEEGQEVSEPQGSTTPYESSSVMNISRAVDLNEDVVESGLRYNRSCDTLLPVSTTPFPLKRCMEPPKWQDGSGDLVINESYDTILDPETLLLVEICDFTSAGIASKKHDAGSDRGYVGIAWGFLMPVSRSGRPCIGIRGGSINNEELGATPRDRLAHYIPSNKTAYAEAERVNKRLTLQLFKWRHNIDPIALAQAKHRGMLPLSAPATSPIPAVFLQWYLRKRVPYPVTLALRIGPIAKPRVQRVSHRPTNCFEIEKGKTKEEHLGELGDYDELELSDVKDELREGGPSKRLVAAGKANEALARRQWQPGSKCALPHKLLVRKSIGSTGATALKYSHCGRWIAVASGGGDGGKFPILLFDLDDEEGHAKNCGVLRAHTSLIHDVDWSSDSHFFVSASNDGSVIVWNVESITEKKKRRKSVEKTDVDSPAPHSPLASSASSHRKGAFVVRVFHPSPSVVYAARFIPRNKPSDSPVGHCPFVVTGSFDGATVLWDPTKEEPNMGYVGNLQAPLHRFSVTALVVEQRTRRIFSGDSDGIVWAWTVEPPVKPEAGEGASSEPIQLSYKPESRPISHNLLRGHTITSLEVQPSKLSRRGACNLLVAAHGSLVLMFDSEAKALIAQYHGASLQVSPIRARFSPDGQFVISGSEDGFISVWHTETSSILAKHEEGITVPVASHTKKQCTLGTMGFNGPLLDVMWNPRQHCVAMVAAGGSFPLIVAYAESPPKESSKDDRLLSTPMFADGVAYDEALLGATLSRKENVGYHRRASVGGALRQSHEAFGGSRGSSLRRPSLNNVLKDSLKLERGAFSNLASPSGKDSFGGFGSSGGLHTPTGNGRINFSGLMTPPSNKQAVRSLAKAKLSEIRAKQFLDQENGEDSESVVYDNGSPPREERGNLAPLSEGAGSSVASEHSPIALPGL